VRADLLAEAALVQQRVVADVRGVLAVEHQVLLRVRARVCVSSCVSVTARACVCVCLNVSARVTGRAGRRGVTASRFNLKRARSRRAGRKHRLVARCSGCAYNVPHLTHAREQLRWCSSTSQAH
jgi:hypothetical protein